VRALVVVAALTRPVSPEFLQIQPQTNHLLATRSGQLRFLGSTCRQGFRALKKLGLLSPGFLDP